MVKDKLRLGGKGGRFGFAWFLPILWKFRRQLGQALSAAFFFELLGLGLPLFVQVMIDKVLVHQVSATLDVVAIGMLLVIVFEGAFGLLKSVLFAHVGNRIDALLSGDVYRHLVRVPLRYFENRRVGDTTARVREVENIRGFLTGPALLSSLDAAFAIVYIAVLLMYSVTLTLVVCGAILALATVTAVIRPPLKRRLEQRFDTGADMQSFLVETVSGMETVKAMALEGPLMRRYDGLAARYVSSSYRAQWLNGMGSGVARMLQNFALLAILFFGAQMAMAGAMTVGALIAFQMIAQRAMAPVLRITQLWQQFQQVGVSIRRLGDLMNAPAETPLNSSKTALPEMHGAMRLEAVTFQYRPDDTPAINELSFSVEPGSFVGIVGRSGSGKSTLAKILQGLYSPDSGRVLLDDIDLRQMDLGWMRYRIGVVPQEGFLFNGTVRENIAIQWPSAPMKGIVEAARLAGAHEFILDLPQGYDTPMGERGTGLSGGQRQRLALARALLGQPRILILDEATSSLDYESERIIYDNLEHIRQNRTVILISHRLSILREADRILVMDEGQLVESGTHPELLSQDSLYRYLCR